ncbi:MAG: hypothetical protein KGJ03_04540 [Betaproteobacteria bacterium]|nr:hypothetical protein [Betaproteobacteria bacterium]
MMQTETNSGFESLGADPRALADRWRAGCLDATDAQRFEQAMAADARLAAHARFGRDLAQELQVLPRLAARRAAPARRLRWARVVAAGMVTAGLAGLSFGILPTLLGSSPGAPAAGAAAAPATPQVADAVQNLDFYEWLASHPQALGTDSGHGGTA